MPSSLATRKLKRAANPERYRASERRSYQNRGAEQTINRQTQQRLWRLANEYGMTQFDYEEMLQAQDFSCAVCAFLFTQTPHVDHCHTTGLVRGLLCASCNLILGKAKDSPVLLRAAAAYLEK